MSMQDKFYEKMSEEYAQFKDDLRSKTPDEIMDKSYELVFKEDFLSHFEYNEMDDSTIEALMTLERPLDSMYREWLHTDASYMDMLERCIDNMVYEIEEREEAREAESKKPTLQEKMQAAQEKVKAQDAQDKNDTKSRKNGERA